MVLKIVLDHYLAIIYTEREEDVSIIIHTFWCIIKRFILLDILKSVMPPFWWGLATPTNR